MTKVLFVSLCLVALFATSAFAYVHQDLQDQAHAILSKINYNLDQLSTNDRESLMKLGFTEGDLKHDDSATSSNNDAALSSQSTRFKQLAKGRQQSRQTTTVKAQATLPTPSSNQGYTATGNRFFIKAFIPGRGCSSDQLEYINVDKCDDSTPAIDGTVDHYVAPAPGPFSEWYRGDERCFSADVDASYRVGVLCEIFKSGSNYQVGCAGNAGHTHHWKRRGFWSNGCFYLDCDRRENFNGRFYSESFTSGTKFRLPLEAANPCVTGAPNVVMDFTVEISIAGGQTSLKLSGKKSRFPGMEGYYKPSSATAYREWFNWGIDDRTPRSLLLPNAAVNWDTRMFPCDGC